VSKFNRWVGASLIGCMVVIGGCGPTTVATRASKLAVERGGKPNKLAVERGGKPDKLAVERGGKPDKLAVERGGKPDKLAVERGGKPNKRLQVTAGSSTLQLARYSNVARD